MDKQSIVDTIVKHLEEEADMLRKAAESSFDEATDEENRAESKYDTRSLETSYLAGGQAKMAVEAQEALSRFKSMPIKSFGEGDLISLSALVEAEFKGVSDFYFMGPASGGFEFKHDGKEIMVITPQSPIGKALLGRVAGDEVSFPLGRETRILRLKTVL